MALKLKNNASSTLAGGITAVATAISVQSADAAKFPTLAAGQWHPITVVDGSGNMEIMRVTARSGAVLTVTRAQEGTSGFAFSAGASVELRPTAGSITEALDEKADADFPTVSDEIHILGNSPRIWLEDENNAGVGRSWFVELNNDTVTFKRDLNADDDAADAGETDPVFSIDGDGATAKSLRWTENFDKSSTNLNNLISSGFYIGNDLTNAPGGSAGRFWILVQLGANDDFVCQTAWAHFNSTSVWHRYKFDGAWGPWKYLSNTTLQELADGTTASSGKKRIPAYDSAGNLAAFGATLDTGTGADLMNAASPAVARNALVIGTGDAVAFARAHGGSDTTNPSFATDLTECGMVGGSFLKASSNGGASLVLQRTGSNGETAQFYRGTAKVGDISVTATATSYNTSSDYRLKYDVVSLVDFDINLEDVDYLYPNMREVMALRPVAHRWIGVDEPTSPFTYGFLAHELQQVFPSAVTGVKDEVVAIGTATIPARTEMVQHEITDDEGEVVEPAVVREVPAERLAGVTETEAAAHGATGWQATGTRPVFQSVDPSKLIAKLIAGMQELALIVLEQRRDIADMKTRIAALGG